MNKRLISLIGAFTLAAALPAFAGPDWQLIEKARKDKQATATATATARHGDAVSTSGTSSAKCSVEPLVLPLDHGPRAQTTRHENQLRKQRHEAELKACEGAKQ